MNNLMNSPGLGAYFQGRNFGENTNTMRLQQLLMEMQRRQIEQQMTQQAELFPGRREELSLQNQSEQLDIEKTRGQLSDQERTRRAEIINKFFDIYGRTGDINIAKTVSGVPDKFTQVFEAMSLGQRDALRKRWEEQSQEEQAKVRAAARESAHQEQRDKAQFERESEKQNKMTERALGLELLRQKGRLEEIRLRVQTVMERAPKNLKELLTLYLRQADELEIKPTDEPNIKIHKVNELNSLYEKINQTIDAIQRTNIVLPKPGDVDISGVTEGRIPTVENPPPLAPRIPQQDAPIGAPQQSVKFKGKDYEILKQVGDTIYLRDPETGSVITVTKRK